ncbi:YdcH family protein [Brevundimonas sp.]
MNDDEGPELTENELALHARLKVLRQEHTDLDASIEALAHMPIPDQLMIARLKRKKLILRDEIVQIEARILPDIIA